MQTSSRAPIPALVDVHAIAGVWQAAQVDKRPGPVVGSGFAALNAALPGGGWPVGALVELLQPAGAALEWGLLAPLVAACQVAGQRVVLVAPPHRPFSPALAACGVDLQAVLSVQVQAPAQRLWAVQQALTCADVGVVLAWLPQARAASLRSLHLTAQTQRKHLFICRSVGAQQESSAAVLRLRLQAGTAPGQLAVQILKRRGPPLTQPLLLDTAAPPVQALLAASHARARQRAQVDIGHASAAASHARARQPQGALAPRLEPSHAVDRVADPALS